MILGRRSMLRLGSLLAMPSMSGGAVFDSSDVHAILGADSEQQQAIVRALRGRFARLKASEDLSALVAGGQPAAYVAVGPTALQKAMSIRLNAPLICMFASRQSFARSMAVRTGEGRATAIYAEPSPWHQMRLIAALYKRTVTVGVLVSEQSGFMVPLLQEAAAEHRLELALAFADASFGLSRNLLRLAQATVLLIFPDTALFTPASLRELLESTYRRRQPVIGFSEALVTAGTLASAYSDIDDTLSQLQVVVAALGNGRLLEPQYPRFWRVAVNDSVARSLDVVVDDAVRRMGDRP